MDRNYSCVISAGTLFLAEELARLEKNAERKHKKERVLEQKRKLMFEAFPDQTTGLSLKGDVRKLIAGEWGQDDAKLFIIDLAFTNPFAPYELKFNQPDFEASLKAVALLVGLKGAVVTRILRTQKEAIKAHHHVDLGKAALWGIGGLAILGFGGWLIAPIIGTAIGTAAGLYGAAATAHGLAILGGGSLALGGAGMAGGMWLVTGIGAAAGILGGGGSTLLWQLGAASAKVELVKLQVSYKEVTLGNQVKFAKSQKVIESLIRERDETKTRLAEEQDLNDRNSSRIKDLEATLEAIEDTLKWMKSVGQKTTDSTPNS
jgi:hypothetical protein